MMKPSQKNGKAIAFAAAFALTFIFQTEANPCTRALYVGDDNLVITGRTMDWFEEMGTNLWVFPRGMERNGGVGPKSIKWTSKYGSLIASVYDIAIGEGVNEKGLAVNLLYLGKSDYGNTADRPQMSVGAYPQFILDNFATVAEAVAGLRGDDIQIIAPPVKGLPSTVHFALSDQRGDSAILEFIEGKLVIHHGKQYKVMTNEPPFDEQLTLNTYWKAVGGSAMLPGTNRPEDRFVRASYFLDTMPEISDSRRGVSAVMSIMRNVSVPREYKDPVKPNLASTIWRSAIDHKNLVYYYEPTSSPYIFWVSLKKLDFEKGAPVKKLELENGERILGGDAADKFEDAEPFKWIAPNNPLTDH